MCLRAAGATGGLFFTELKMEATEWLAVFERIYREKKQAFDVDEVTADFAGFLARNCGMFAPAEISLLIEIGVLLRSASEQR